MKKARKEAKVSKVKRQLTRREKVLRFRRRTVLAFILASVIFLVVMLGVKPLLQMRSSNQEVKAREARLAAERAKTQELEDKKQQAGSAEMIEEEARRLGYVMPGEIPIVILEPTSTEPAQSSGTSSDASGDASDDVPEGGSSGESSGR